MKFFNALLAVAGLCTQQGLAQQVVRIKNSETQIQYLQREDSKATTAIRSISVNIEFWSAAEIGNSEYVVNFGIVDTRLAPLSSPEIYMASMSIPADSFNTTHKTKQVTIPVTLHAVNVYMPEYFTIGLKNSVRHFIDPSTAGLVGVSIQKAAFEKKAEEKKEGSIDGLTYMNGINFDFDGSGGTSYVGHLNVYKADLIPVKFGKKHTHIGFNMGILKINFSRKDSLNNSYYYFENALINPLDPVETGTKYLRQYNNLSTISKNITWSFYFQPNITLYNDATTRIMFHLLAEFYVNKWNTNTTIVNFTQDSSIMTADNIAFLKDSITTFNKFYKSTTEVIKSSSHSTELNFNTGAGLSFEIVPWKGAQVFIHHTTGIALNYARPTSISSKDLNYIEGDRHNSWGHLSRFSLSQKLSSNLQIIIGVDVRGLYKNNPTWASYLGLNLGLDGIKKLIND